MRVAVTVPPGLGPGRQLRVQCGARQYDVFIPNGVPPGGQFLMEVDAPPANSPAPQHPEMSVPMGLPVGMERGAPPPPSHLNRTSTAGGRQIVEAMQRSQADTKAECPICFEPLCQAPVGVFLGPDGRRVSQHFFNLAAAREWLIQGSGMCPLTRRRIQQVASREDLGRTRTQDSTRTLVDPCVSPRVLQVLEVPDIRADPEGWFRAVDIDGDGRLSRLEVVECLKAQLPIDAAALDAAALDGSHWMWQQWDNDRSGCARAPLPTPLPLATRPWRALTSRVVCRPSASASLQVHRA